MRIWEDGERESCHKVVPFEGRKREREGRKYAGEECQTLT